MLHTSKPVDYFPQEALAQIGICPECSTHITLAVGVIHLGHYFNGQNVVSEGLLWTCSDKCFLNFEARQYMARA